MLRADFGKKCIIMHFLGMEKYEKVPERRGADGKRHKATEKAGPSELGMTPFADGRAILKSLRPGRSVDPRCLNFR
jgi:hypothetical protein